MAVVMSGYCHASNSSTANICSPPRRSIATRVPGAGAKPIFRVAGSKLETRLRWRDAMRTLLAIILVAIVGFAAYTYIESPRTSRPGADAVGTSGKVDVNAARERGAEVGEKVATAAE